MIQNKESLVYSLENSINNLEAVVKESVKINTPQQKEVYNSLGTALLIGSCLDRLENIEYTDRYQYHSEKDGIFLFLGDNCLAEPSSYVSMIQLIENSYKS